MHSYRSEGYPEKVTPWFEFTGLQSTKHAAQVPIDIEFVSGASPILKGLSNWTTIKEELYNNSSGKLLDTATCLARGKQTFKKPNGEVRVDDYAVVWTNMYREKTKVFATTLGHNNDTVGDDRYLTLVTRGLLWATDKLDKGYGKE